MRLPCLALLVLVALARCGGSYADLGTGTPPPEGIELAVTAVRDTDDGVDVDLELRNDSQQRLVYQGYSTEQPIFAYEYLTDVAWVRPAVILCGTGLRAVELAPGQRVKVTARVFSPNRLRRVRVGIEAEGGYVVWSPVIDPASGKFGTRVSAKSSR